MIVGQLTNGSVVALIKKKCSKMLPDLAVPGASHTVFLNSVGIGPKLGAFLASFMKCLSVVRTNLKIKKKDSTFSFDTLVAATSGLSKRTLNTIHGEILMKADKIQYFVVIRSHPHSYEAKHVFAEKRIHPHS